MKTLLLLPLLVGLVSSQTICREYCDGADADVVEKPYQAFRVEVEGRVIDLHLSDVSNMAYASIGNGYAGDHVWMDRSFDGAWTWSKNLADTIVPTRPTVRTGATSIAINIDGDLTKQQIGVIRACGWALKEDATICTPWFRSKKLAATPESAAATALMQLYSNLGSWLTVGWWNSANCLTTMINYQRITGDTSYEFAIDTTYEKNKKNNDFITESVDDTAWWGLAWAKAYQLTNNSKYLDNAVRIADYLQTFNTSKCDGGLVWSEESQYKNAITNELFIKLTGLLHNIIPGDTKYLEWAKQSFNWFVNSGLINKDNLINDGLTDGCTNNKQTTWTYNQGVILGAAVQLYKATNDLTYLMPAMDIANAVIASSKLSPNGILHEPCDTPSISCDRDAPVFKGVFASNLAELAVVYPNKDFIAYINNNAQKILENANSINQYGLHYEGPFESFTASTQQSALDMILAAKEIRK